MFCLGKTRYVLRTRYVPLELDMFALQTRYVTFGNMGKEEKMQNYIDLHTHSTKSDGSYTPKDLIRLAEEIGLYAIALTDHDNTDGLSEAEEEAKNRKVKFIPGIELSCDYESELHIVGLFIDYKCDAMVKATRKFKEDRKTRNINTIKRLNDAGVDITLEEASKYCPGDALGRAHIAKVMVDKGYSESVKDAFKKYLGKGKPGYSNELRISVYEAIDLIKKSGGISILAHCHYLGLEGEDFYNFVKDLKEHGLDGLEGYYTEYTKEQSEFYIETAKRLGLKISGGTDFHGAMKPAISLGTGFGNLKIPKEILNKLQIENEK